MPKLITPKGPTPLPGIGNMRDITSKEGNIPAYHKLVQTYGSMVFLQMPNIRIFVCTDADVLQDMLKRPEEFQKQLGKALRNLRAHTTGDGLFTCNTNEEIWEMAHRILMQGFTVQAIHHYYGAMLEVADELLAHLDAIPANEPVLITDWMTRMTFEAISYAGFSTKFHSMDQKELPPFVEAMTVSLMDAMASLQRHLPDSSYLEEMKKREQSDRLLHEVVDKLIQERQDMIARGEVAPNDLLQIMLASKDRLTGMNLPLENVRNQLITFLIAGHETTSGLLSYAIYHLMNNPAIEAKFIEEVDRVLGRDYSYKPTYEELEQMPYASRILKETLRLNPTAPFFNLFPMHDTVVADKYALQKGDQVMFFLEGLHRNSDYWGTDVDTFDPDRFLPEAVEKRHPDAYHPFGAGIRSCIGFRFSLKEATMVLTRLYQRYRFSLKDKNYQLRHVETLTVKPKDLYVLIEKRPAS